MTQYTKLAEYYDSLTDDVPYDVMADRLAALMEKGATRPRLVLELGCGTGSISRRLSQRGLELIAVDSSPEMLGIAREKCEGLPVPPVFVCQDMEKLDLYGTVQAAVCTLDSLNYLPDTAALGRAFAKVSLFLETRGLFIFDIKSPAMFQSMAGTTSVSDRPGCFCVWQYSYEETSRRAVHIIDLFEKQADGYHRYTETHFQRAFTQLQVEEQLRRANFRLDAVYQDYSARRADTERGRLLFVAERR